MVSRTIAVVEMRVVEEAHKVGGAASASVRAGYVLAVHHDVMAQNAVTATQQ